MLQDFFFLIGYDLEDLVEYRLSLSDNKTPPFCHGEKPQSQTELEESYCLQERVAEGTGDV